MVSVKLLKSDLKVIVRRVAAKTSDGGVVQNNKEKGAKPLLVKAVAYSGVFGGGVAENS